MIDRVLSQVLRVFDFVNIPIKIEAKGTTAKILGFVIDCNAKTMSIPHNRLQQLLLDLASLCAQTTPSAKDYLRVVGLLTWASQILYNARCYLTNMWKYASICNTRKLSKAHLSDDIRADLRWFSSTLTQWPSFHYLRKFAWETNVDIGIASDSGRDGFGIVTKDLDTFGFWCKGCYETGPTSAFELAAVAIGLHTFGQLLTGYHLVWVTDNQGNVSAFTNGTSRDPTASFIIRDMGTSATRLQFDLTLLHIPRAHIPGCDMLTRQQHTLFSQTYPDKRHTPYATPPFASAYASVCAAYERQALRFGWWADDDHAVFPITQNNFDKYLAYQLQRVNDGTIKISTLRSYLSALRDVHIAQQIPFDFYKSNHSRRLISIAKNNAPPTPSRQKPEVSLQTLTQFIAALQLTIHDESIAAPIATTSFWGLARRGEILAESLSGVLRIRHVTRIDIPPTNNSDHAYSISIPLPKIRKTDVQHLVLKPINDCTCSVTAIDR
ncbi:hypothetical protein HK097_004736, partial [Rhizophlyctis rosea]